MNSQISFDREGFGSPILQEMVPIDLMIQYLSQGKVLIFKIPFKSLFNILSIIYQLIHCLS